MQIGSQILRIIILKQNPRAPNHHHYQVSHLLLNILAIEKRILSSPLIKNDFCLKIYIWNLKLKCFAFVCSAIIREKAKE